MTAPVVPAGADAGAKAAQILESGGLVAIPTETVYGLAADANNAEAVARLFAAKARPRFNPLIVHIPGLDAANAVARLTPAARTLAARFWPGPLTLVCDLAPGAPVCDLARAGLDSVAVRAPASPAAQQLLQAFGRPIVAPSANPSGALSPTRAIHVAEALGDQVDLIIDAGSCVHGVESTVVDVRSAPPVLLRPGALPRSEIESVFGVLGTPQADASRRSPGTLTKHYAPKRARLRLDADAPRPGEAYLGFGPCCWSTLNLSVHGDLAEAARRVFGYLAALDHAGYEHVAIAPIPDTGLGEAINDRLRRGAAA